MCGGAGTRLWPASREGRPKQFLPLFGQYSTFQDTIRRIHDRSLFGRPIVVTNAEYRFLVAEQLSEIGTEADIILEPVRRDSAPAVAAGALFATRRAGDAIVVDPSILSLFRLHRSGTVSAVFVAMAPPDG